MLHLDNLHFAISVYIYTLIASGLHLLLSSLQRAVLLSTRHTVDNILELSRTYLTFGLVLLNSVKHYLLILTFAHLPCDTCTVLPFERNTYENTTINKQINK